MFITEQEFIGVVFGHKTRYQGVFWTMQFLHEVMEDRGIINSSDDTDLDLSAFMGDLMWCIEKAWSMSDYTLEELESELFSCIEKAKTLKELKFEISNVDFLPALKCRDSYS